jgi:hypothetical protein
MLRSGLPSGQSIVSDARDSLNQTCQGARDSLNQRVSAILTSVLVRDAVDVIAWDVFERAETQQPITLAMIERRVDKSNDDKTARRE